MLTLYNTVKKQHGLNVQKLESPQYFEMLKIIIILVDTVQKDSIIKLVKCNTKQNISK